MFVQFTPRKTRCSSYPDKTTTSHTASRSRTRQSDQFTPTRRPSTWNTGYPASSESQPISVHDVVHLMDKERARSSYQNRREVLAQAQRQVRNDDNMSRPPSGVSAFSIRRNSCRTPKFSSSRVSSAVSVVHPNSPNMDDLQAATVEQCCEVMGPSLCRECHKLSSRNAIRQLTDSSFPGLRLTQENIVTAALVKRFFPGLSHNEAQTMVARGDIARMTFPNYLRGERADSGEDSGVGRKSLPNCLLCEHGNSVQKPESDSRESSRPKTTEHAAFILARLKMKMKHFGKPSTPLYFYNVRDLNYKLMTGVVSRDLVKYKPRNKYLLFNTSSNDDPSGDSLCPVFVSPRKVKMVEEPSYKVYFGPPLLARENQLPNPPFFAGSDL